MLTKDKRESVSLLRWTQIVPGFSAAFNYAVKAVVGRDPVERVGKIRASGR